MIVVLLVEHFSDAVAQAWVGCNLRHDCSLKGSIVNVEFDDDEVSRLTYAPDDVQRVRGLLEIICDWSVVEVQPAQPALSSLLRCLGVHCLCMCKHSGPRQVAR